MAKSPLKKLIVVQPEEKPVSNEVLAASIVRISDEFARATSTGLNRRALVVLLKDATGVAQYEINKILDALPDLKAMYCKPAKAK